MKRASPTVLSKFSPAKHYLALAILYLALLALSPAEAILGNVVKIVYAHGAAQRIAAYAYLIAAALGIAQFVVARNQAKPLSQPIADTGIASHKTLAMKLEGWTRAVTEIALLFWLAQFIISIPAQMLAWGGFTLNEPRVAAALAILALTMLIYGVARWMGEPTWLTLGAIANAAVLLIILRGAANVLHPIDPIIGSDSLDIKLYYLAIVAVTGAIAFQIARDLVAREKTKE